MAVAWSIYVPQNFYGMTSSVSENIITTEFESGKKKTRLKNSSVKRTYSVNLDLWSQTELSHFWSWYDDVLLGRAQSVLLPDLAGTSAVKEYRITEEPSIEGQHPKILTLTFEEV